MKKKENKKIITDPEAIINTSYSNNRTNKVINKSFLHNTTNTIINENRPKNYELFNVVSETGDSIYSPDYEEFTILDYDDEAGGQIFVSETAIEEIINRIIDQMRLGPSINNNKNDN